MTNSLYETFLHVITVIHCDSLDAHLIEGIGHSLDSTQNMTPRPPFLKTFPESFKILLMLKSRLQVLKVSDTVKKVRGKLRVTQCHIRFLKHLISATSLH